MVRRIREVTNIDNPDKDTNDSDNLGQHITEIVQLAFQGGLFADLRGDGLVNISNGSLLTSVYNNSSSGTIYNCSSLVK